MEQFDVFVGFLAYELGKVDNKEIFSETKLYERKYREIYRTEVISTYYNEVGVIFSVEEVDEDLALTYFEKQQAENYGTVDLDEFRHQFTSLLTKKEGAVSQLKDAASVISTFKKEIQRFEKVFDPKELTSKEQAETEREFHELRQLKQNLEHIERVLTMISL